MATKTIIANWKMYLSLKQSVDLAKKIKQRASLVKTKNKIIICPSFTAIDRVGGVIKNSSISLGALDVATAEKGSWTGEVSAENLKELGCKYVVCGHSERRQKMGETNRQISAKVSQILAKIMIPVLCVGETKKERDKKLTTKVITKQLAESLKNIKISTKQRLIVAYEPIWAISNGKKPALIPKIKEIEQIHQLIGKILTKKYSSAIFKKSFQVIYGGSVNSKNKELLESKYIDGAIIGGASLKVDDFMSIVDFEY